MTTYKKSIGENTSPDFEGKGYRTLEEIDLSDIAQAIDGGKSIGGEKDSLEEYTHFESNNTLPVKKFWFW